MKNAKNIGGAAGFAWGTAAITLHYLKAENWAADIISSPVRAVLAAMSSLTPHFYKYLFFEGGIPGIMSDLLMIMVYSISLSILVLASAGLMVCIMTITQKLHGPLGKGDHKESYGHHDQRML